MSSMPYLTLVSKQSTYVHVNYHQSSFHFIQKFCHQSNFHLIRKNYFYQSNFYFTIEIFSSMELLFKQRYTLMDPASNYGNNYFHQSSFYWMENLISSIQLLFMGKIISINPTSILNTGMFSSIPLPFRKNIFFINPASIVKWQYQII